MYKQIITDDISITILITYHTIFYNFDYIYEDVQELIFCINSL